MIIGGSCIVTFLDRGYKWRDRIRNSSNFESTEIEWSLLLPLLPLLLLSTHHTATQPIKMHLMYTRDEQGNR